MYNSAEISIPRAFKNEKDSVFTKSYTVIYSKLYEIQVKINGECQAITNKRYSELRSLYEKVSSKQLKSISDRPEVSNFPEKTLFNMSSKTIDSRRLKIEAWLNVLLKFDELSGVLYDFLEISMRNLPIPEPDIPEYIRDFINNINSNQNRMKTLEKFEWVFFTKKTSIRPSIIKMILESLIPLLGNEFIGNKALDLISKLTTSYFYRYSDVSVAQLLEFSPTFLKSMCLDKFLTKQRYGESQLQAYTICKVLESAHGTADLIKILNNDSQAFEIFEQWGAAAIEETKVEVKKTEQDWRLLIDDENKALHFRFIGRELEMRGNLLAKSTVGRVIEALTVPEKRKLWDLRMQEMEQVEQEGGFVLTYKANRKLYEFHSKVEINEAEGQAEIKFDTKCYKVKRVNAVLGEFDSVYNIGPIEGNSEIIKIAWKAHFCENSFELVKGDLFQEDNMLRLSFTKLIDILTS